MEVSVYDSNAGTTPHCTADQSRFIIAVFCIATSTKGLLIDFEDGKR